MVAAVAPHLLPYLCGHGYRVQCRKSSSPSVYDYNIGHVFGNAVIACSHCYVKTHWLFDPIPVLVAAAITGTRATPASPTSTCRFVGAAAPAAQLLVASVSAMWTRGMPFGVTSKNGNNAPAGKPARIAFSATSLVDPGS